MPHRRGAVGGGMLLVGAMLTACGGAGAGKALGGDTVTSAPSTTVPAGPGSGSRPGTTTRSTAVTPGPGATVTIAPSNAVVATVSDNGRRITVARRGTLQVRLVTCSGCAARWRLIQQADAAVLRYGGEKDEMPAGGAVLPGGGGGGSGPILQIFMFTAIGDGTTSLGSTESGSSPTAVSTYGLTVTVSG